MLHIDIQRKSYNSKIIFEDVQIQIENAGLYGLVGKNGSGKSTFFKCLNHLTDFQGKITYNGKALSSEKVAFLPTEPFLYEYLTVKEFMDFYAQLVHIPKKQVPIFDIDNKLLIKELSTGMRKKVYLNAVFQKTYEIYIFDEPFNGLDIHSVYQLRKIISQLSENHIVFISSHILESLHQCRSIFLLKDKTFHTIPPENYAIIESMLFST